MACQKLQNKTQQRDHNKGHRKSEWVSYLCIVLVTTRPDGSLQVSGAIFPIQNLHESCHNDDEDGFSLWSEQCHFTEDIRAWKPPMVSFCLWMAKQQVNAAHMEKAAARVLIIKEALWLSSCIVPLVMAISEFIILFNIDSARLSSAARWYSGHHIKACFPANCTIALRQWQLHQKTQPCTEIAGDNAFTQQATFWKHCFLPPSKKYS